MGMFDFLFGTKLSIENLSKLENDDEIKVKLRKSKLKDLEKLCLTKCQDLDTEDKQKEVYINAILDVIHKARSPMASSMSTQLDSKPVEIPPEDTTPMPIDMTPTPQRPTDIDMDMDKKMDEPPKKDGGKKRKTKKGLHGGRTRRRRKMKGDRDSRRKD